MRMNFPTKALVLGLLLAGGTILAPCAQERSAGGSVDTQMTWTTLTNLVNSANTKTEAVNARMDQVVKCNKKFKVYAPGVTGADTDGCIDNALLLALDSRVDKMEYCGKQSKIYNATTNACVMAAADPVAPASCKMLYSTGTKRTGSMNTNKECGDGTGGWTITGSSTSYPNSNTTQTETTCQKLVCN